MVLRMRFGASSTVTGAISRVISALAGSVVAALDGIGDCICAGRSLDALAPITTAPPNLISSLRLMIAPRVVCKGCAWNSFGRSPHTNLEPGRPHPVRRAFAGRAGDPGSVAAAELE